jgi:predicted dehydrogenase
MAEPKYGCAVFGAGWVAGEHLNAYVADPRCEVVAVGSRREESATAKALQSGLSLDQVAIYTDYEKLLADERVDVVSITTPNHLHPQETIAAAQAGKHMCIEKPVAHTLDELRAMRDAVRAAGVKTVVSFVLHWNPSFINTKALLAAGAIGDLFYAEVDYWHGVSNWYAGWEWCRKVETGGSTWLFAGCHALDAARYFAGDIVEVSACEGGWDMGEDRFEYPPTAVATVKYVSGAIGKVSSSLDIVAPYSFNVDLLGTKGTIRDNRVWSKALFPGQKSWVAIPTILPDSGDVAHHPFEGQISHLIDCIEKGEESHVNLEDAVKTHEVAIACSLSAADGGQPVKLPLLA